MSMAGKKDDLRLGLSLSFSSDATTNCSSLSANKSADIGISPIFQMRTPSSSLASSHHHLQLNLMTLPTSSSTTTTTSSILSPPSLPAARNNQINTFPHHFSASADRASMNGSTRVATTIGVLTTAPPLRSVNVLTKELPPARSINVLTTAPPPARSINVLTTATPPRSINVNRLPESNDAGVSSPNSTISSVSGKRCDRESASASDEDDDGGETFRKKLRLSKDQSLILEDTFKQHNTLNPKQKLALAKRLDLRPRQVEVWFQNRRARTKLKQTEVDCEFLKRCCQQLTEENRRLQKEVQELRALKLSPHFLMQMTPPTTLTICPSCECITPTR